MPGYAQRMRERHVRRPSKGKLSANFGLFSGTTLHNHFPECKWKHKHLRMKLFQFKFTKSVSRSRFDAISIIRNLSGIFSHSISLFLSFLLLADSNKALKTCVPLV